MFHGTERKGTLGSQMPLLFHTWKTVHSNCLDSLFWITEKSLARGLRKLVGFRQCCNKFCTVTRMSSSVSWESGETVFQYFVERYSHTHTHSKVLVLLILRSDFDTWNNPASSVLGLEVCTIIPASASYMLVSEAVYHHTQFSLYFMIVMETVTRTGKKLFHGI